MSNRTRFPRSIETTPDADLQLYRSRFTNPNDRTKLIDEVLRLRRELRRLAPAASAVGVGVRIVIPPEAV